MHKRFVSNMHNMYFLFLTFITGLFYFCFYLVSLILGLSLCFTLIGVPILSYVMRTTQTFVQYERIQTKLYADITVEPYPEKPRIEGSLWAQAKDELLDHRNWSAISWLMLKFIIGLIALISAVFVYVAPALFILTPVLFQVVDIQLMGMPIDTFTKSLYTMAGGFVLAIVGAWLGNGLVRMVGGYTRHMINRLIR
jgi:hypothetical protein